MKKNSFISNLSMKLFLVLLAANLGCSTFAGVDLNPLGSNSKKTTAANEIKDKALKSAKKQQAEVLVNDKKAKVKEAENEEVTKHEKGEKKHKEKVLENDQFVCVKDVVNHTGEKKLKADVLVQNKKNLIEPTKEKKIKNYREQFLDINDRSNYEYYKMYNVCLGSEKFDTEKYRDKSEKLYKKIKEFVQRSDELGVSAEDFDEYIKNYMESGNKHMKVVGSHEFRKLATRPKMLKLYKKIRGDLCDKCDKIGKGVVSMWEKGCCEGAFSDYNNVDAYGYNIETYTDKKLAQNYGQPKFLSGNLYNMQKNEKTGMEWFRSKEPLGKVGIVEILFDRSKFKIIEINEIDCIAATMKYWHPDAFGLVESFDRRIPADLYNSFQYEIFKKAFKKTFGFDCEEVASRINPNYRSLKAGEDENAFMYLVEHIFSYSRHRGLTEKFNENFDKLMKKNKTKAHYVNKYFKVLSERGLLAKLLGYDAFIFLDNDVHVVNPESIVVCGDSVKIQKWPVTFDDFIKYLYVDLKNM